MNEKVKGVFDQLMTRFFQAVSFEAGHSPHYENIHPLFIEGGLLIKNSTATPEISGVAEFIAPRKAMVASGEWSRFQETELFERTEIFGNVAHRFSGYSKSGTLNEVPFEARGMLSTQFIRTPQGWKISSMAWDDEREGLCIPGHDAKGQADE
jgi:hypothetical protein